MKKLDKNQRALLHMKLILDDGTVVEDSHENNKPCLIQLGDESLSTAFENQIIGLKENQSKQFRLSAEDAFGVSNPALIHYMELQQFPEPEALKMDQLIPFSQPNGQPLMGIIKNIAGQSVTVDFNHPLVDKAVTFEVEMLRINPLNKMESGQKAIPLKMS